MPDITRQEGGVPAAEVGKNLHDMFNGNPHVVTEVDMLTDEGFLAMAELRARRLGEREAFGAVPEKGTIDEARPGGRVMNPRASEAHQQGIAMTRDPNNKPQMTEQEESKAIDRAFDNQLKDMTSSALIYAASVVGMLLLWLGGPAVLAVLMPAFTFSAASLTRSWKLVKMTRRRRDRHAHPASDLHPRQDVQTAASPRDPHDR
jgi:hypothetical protein